MTEEESLIDFPCEFKIKIAGASLPEFQQRVIAIIKKHDPLFNKDTHLKSRPSRTGRYLGLTATIYAVNKAQLNALYHDLSQCEWVSWAL